MAAVASCTLEVTPSGLFAKETEQRAESMNTVFTDALLQTVQPSGPSKSDGSLINSTPSGVLREVGAGTEES